MLTPEQIRLAEDAAEETIAAGRPHGRNDTYPDGCECDICEAWDALERRMDAQQLEQTAAAHERRERAEQDEIEQQRQQGNY